LAAATTFPPLVYSSPITAGGFSPHSPESICRVRHTMSMPLLAWKERMSSLSILAPICFDGRRGMNGGGEWRVMWAGWVVGLGIVMITSFRPIARFGVVRSPDFWRKSCYQKSRPGTQLLSRPTHSRLESHKRYGKFLDRICSSGIPNLYFIPRPSISFGVLGRVST